MSSGCYGKKITAFRKDTAQCKQMQGGGGSRTYFRCSDLFNRFTMLPVSGGGE